MTDRERFEEWAGSLASFCPDIKRKGYSYESMVTAAAWHGWQASRKQALEDAAEAMSDGLRSHDVPIFASEREDIEARIRALASPEGEQG